MTDSQSRWGRRVGPRRTLLGSRGVLRTVLTLACVSPSGCFEPEPPGHASASGSTVGESTSAAETSTSGPTGPSMTTEDPDSTGGDPDTTASSSGAEAETETATSGACQPGVFGTAMFGVACFS